MCYFKAHELVDPKTYALYGERSLRYIDKRIINILQFLRDYYKSPLTVNDYMFGGKYKESGLRIPSLFYFKQYSCHSFGRAMDIKIKNVKAVDVQKDILNAINEEVKLLGLTAIEKDTPTWTHISVSNFDGWEVEENNGIKILKG